MNFGYKRAGAVASAMVLFAAGFSLYGAGASAQDAAQDAAQEQAQSDAASVAQATQNAQPAPAIRFVASEMVQNVPEAPVPAQEPEAPAQSSASSLYELVAATPADGEMSREVTCLAKAVYFEARGEELAGQLAVAQVVINRANSTQFPDDYCSVVTQRAQFSFVRGGRIPQPNANSHAWQRARAIARIAHRDLWDSRVDDALYFHATHVSPRWARHKSARGRIDSHLFYR